MKKILTIISALVLVTGMSSCLKEKPEIGGTPQNIIEFYTTDAFISGARALYPVYGKNFTTGQEGTFDVTVSYSGTDVAPSDITVDVAVSPDALAKFNASAPASGEPTYLQLDPSAYTLSATKVVIKAGERRATFSVKVVLPLTFDFDKSYALPLSITTASTGTISGNFGSVLYRVGGKNKYDGTYESTGQFIHPTAGTRELHADKHLTTTGSATVQTNMGDIANTFQITVNADNTVTLVGTVNAANDVIPQPGMTNTYDPATKTFHLHYQYAGGGGNRVINEDLKFLE